MSTSFKILCVSIGVLAGLSLAPKLMTARTSNEATLTVTQPDSLDLYIEALAFQESSGKEDVVVLDTNGKYSRGCLQFQDETFRRFQAKYKIAGPIMDCPTQKRLARAILLGSPTGWTNWRKSVDKIGLPPGLPS
jgi:hypothetical protein